MIEILLVLVIRVLMLPVLALEWIMNNAIWILSVPVSILVVASLIALAFDNEKG